MTDRSTGKIVPSAREALDRLEANGHFVAIATGRAHYKARKFTEANGFKKYGLLWRQWLCDQQ